MFSYIRGRFIQAEDGICVVDVGGIGYEIFTTIRDINYITRKNIEDVKFYTKLIHKEDLMEIYGFLNRSDLTLFKLLLLVKGIGPKQAVKIINATKSEEIVKCIYSGDSEFLRQISGIGKKKAEQIIVELKERIKKEFSIDEDKIESLKDAGDNYIEAIKALEILGFTGSEIRRVIGDIRSEKDAENYTTEEIVQKALSLLASL